MRSRWFLILTLMQLALVTLSQNLPNGFININCGVNEGEIQDTETNLVYISDAQYVESGVAGRVSDDYAFQLPEKLRTLRSFPEGTFNCYMLNNLSAGQKYLVRAIFVYGNYDGKGYSEISFDLFLDGLFWTTMLIANNGGTGVYTEVITMSRTTYMSVCLNKTKEIIPFISLLELRQLNQRMYPAVNLSTSLSLISRIDLGGNKSGQIRYPDDPYDRFWDPQSTQNIVITQDWKRIYTNSLIGHENTDMFEFPTSVMQTAITPTSFGPLYFSFDWIVEELKKSLLYVFMGFAGFSPTKSTIFEVGLNGKTLLVSNLTNQTSDYVYTIYPEDRTKYEFSLVPTLGSELAPLLNAVEVYYPINSALSEQPTNTKDFYALISVKHQYNFKKNWMGDPCLPRSVGTWYGITCNYNSSGGTVIQKLNLSSSDLTGEIDASFANLTSIDSLDLSLNSLEGPVPEFFGNMPLLRVLNLSGNRLSGLVPTILQQRSRDNLLVLSVEGNQDLCMTEDMCKKNKSTKIKLSVLISIVVIAFLVVLALIAWFIKRSGFPRRNYVKEIRGDNSNNLVDSNENTLQIDSQHFTYKDLQKITNNFEHEIGKGGFGPVYSGRLYNGTHVAVKILAQSSSQGTKEFLAEVCNLSRLHHRSLVNLIGYCKDRLGCKALVYEYLSGGCLRTYLRGNDINSKVLSWEERLRILLEASQALLYLHRECNPPIIHRDVKTENILLNEKLEAKISDFGLSKDVQENCTHVSTVVTGTLGYLDPEYHFSFQLTEKSDVYSFGVVLLETVTTQPPIIEGAKHEKIHLKQWVHQKLAKGTMDDVVDVRLLGRYDVNSAWKIVELGLKCCAETSVQRPVMSDVVAEIKESWELVVDLNNRRMVDSVRSTSSRRIAFEVEKNGKSSLPEGPSVR